KVSDDVVLDRLSLPQAERTIILAALEGAGWNQSEAARRLGVSRKVLRTKIKNLGLRTAA
ncbi:MAG: two component signal transduction response regulator, partial [Candidatus Methylomirabilis sp.]|nr:two component signal transduction response regulator [Deltaproteobacteria bacterium]